MTLDTKIVIHQYTDIHELRKWINENLLNAPEAIPWDCGPNTAHNAGMQGLDAWLMIEGSPDSPIEWVDADEADKETIEYYSNHPKGYVKVSFDTGYGYRGPKEQDCSLLHADYIVRLAMEYLTPKGLTFHWQNEYTGEWHEGLNAEALKELVRNGKGAGAWFDSLPMELLLGMDSEDD